MEPLQLVQQNVEKININLCIICQKSKPREKLSSTDTGRNKLLRASNILKDGLFDEFNDNGQVLSIILTVATNHIR